ncbi:MULTISPECIES: flavin reductase family protein [Streptomyces]|uniref:Flavin reductase family protein n=2 Tax=Streptomyces TaxID=1883 RepID=A0ABW6YWK6_9ACTN|nr:MULTISPECIES: flavin reductase family protein [Streptomyces]MBK3522045.1 flavin reductase family protein [Streptomyces sp. MBT70]MCL3992224.1 flavin reductase family protein [Streptomyces lavenduligriseus]QIS73783.1 flavin reductase family protein [Streptomyces sp. DSM 40868]WDM10344.1 flavin reductase family protein [Streptomyces lavenduligriseus]GGR95784.1 hypothetical protein GCM10010236_57980 [Streptomyces eurythermus]
MPIDRTVFTHAMAQVPAPVTVVTTVTPEGRRHGFTASSFCSLSADPPLILVCLAKTASSHEAFLRTAHFMVNLLGADHHGIAQRFATPDRDKFADGPMLTSELGLPGLPDATVRLACAVHSILDGGDHSILIGQVEQAAVLEQPPLVYHNRQYATPRPRSLAGTP